MTTSAIGNPLQLVRIVPQQPGQGNPTGERLAVGDANRDWHSPKMRAPPNYFRLVVREQRLIVERARLAARMIARQNAAAETIGVLVATIASCPEKQRKLAANSNQIEYWCPILAEISQIDHA
jgi:hypothetical protein